MKKILTTEHTEKRRTAACGSSAETAERILTTEHTESTEGIKEVEYFSFPISVSSVVYSRFCTLCLRFPARLKKYFFIPLLFLASCSYVPVGEGVEVAMLPVKRQKQRLMVLEKRLESAEKQRVKVIKEIEALHEEIEGVELAIVRKVVENAEAGGAKKGTNLFLAERETLHRLIQSGPSKTSFEAQVVLDQILRMITNLSE
jgi:hypothetical protein